MIIKHYGAPFVKKKKIYSKKATWSGYITVKTISTQSGYLINHFYPKWLFDKTILTQNGYLIYHFGPFVWQDAKSTWAERARGAYSDGLQWWPEDDL